MQAKIVFITMLATADKDRVVRATLPKLALMAGLSEAETDAALCDLIFGDYIEPHYDNEWRVIRANDYLARQKEDWQRKYRNRKAAKGK